MSVIDQYLHFKCGSAVCSVPYYNNKTIKTRAALRPYIGKGSPQEIHDEVRAVALRDRIVLENLADESLKKLLTDEGLGIDCSGFAYYVLNAESEERDKGKLDRHISFVHCEGLMGKIRCSLRPVENCGVMTLSHDSNSRLLKIEDVMPGDMITMTSGDAIPRDAHDSIAPETPRGDRDHVLVVHQVDYQNFVPAKLHYTHAVAYPEDGVYGTGIRQGTIEIVPGSASLTECIWTEDGKTGAENRVFMRAKKSKTELRRLKWW